METIGATPRNDSPDPIAHALACYDAERNRRGRAHAAQARPAFKALVLTAVPNASVRRVGASFECYIGDVLVNCSGEHSTPDKAWLCLARFVVAQEGRA